MFFESFPLTLSFLLSPLYLFSPPSPPFFLFPVAFMFPVFLPSLPSLLSRLPLPFQFLSNIFPFLPLHPFSPVSFLSFFFPSLPLSLSTSLPTPPNSCIPLDSVSACNIFPRDEFIVGERKPVWRRRLVHLLEITHSNMYPNSSTFFSSFLYHSSFVGLERKRDWVTDG